MRRPIRLTGLIALILFVIGGSIVPVHAQGDAGWLLGQINALRARYGAGPLAINAALTSSATAHSQYLANNVWSDPHVEANGSTPRSRTIAAGFTGPIGENVYGGGIATAAIAFTWWVNEPTHFRSLIYTGFNVVGIGIASGPYGHYFTLDFGGDGSVNAAPAPTTAPPDRAQPNGASAPVANVATTAPIPTRRPRPTDTPTITFTPTITYTPLPSNTPAPTDSPIPPTATAIVLEVSPQSVSTNQTTSQPESDPSPGATLTSAAIVALLPSSTATIAGTMTTAVMTNTLLQPSITLTASAPSTATSTPIGALTSSSPAIPGQSNTMFGMLIVAGIGLQGLIVAGFVVRQIKNR